MLDYPSVRLQAFALAADEARFILIKTLHGVTRPADFGLFGTYVCSDVPSHLKLRVWRK